MPGFHFAGCRIDYPFVEEPFELLLSEDLYLSSFAYLDEQHWLKGFDDSLQNRRGRHWGRLMVLKSDVAKFWPFDVAGEAAAPLRTGAPGRPSSIHLVEIEFRARCGRNEVESSLAQEADVLAAWLRKEHPNSPPLNSKDHQKQFARRISPAQRGPKLKYRANFGPVFRASKIL